jgi:hypothetical protein
MRLFIVAVAVACAALSPASAQAQGEGRAAGSDAEIIAEMAGAAQALIDATGGPQPTAQTMGFTPSELLHHTLNSSAREDWSYWPRAREGLALGQMTAGQRVRAHALLESLLSARGYLEVQSIWSLEAVLGAREASSFPRGIEHYAFAVFGVPGTDEPWGWRVDGHHVSLNVTVAEGEIAVTPSFFGANPARVDAGPQAGLEPLRYETRAAFALLGSLDERRRTMAIIAAEAPRDILSGQLGRPREAWGAWREATAAEGLRASDMNRAQRALLSALLDEIVARYRPEIAEAERAAIDIGDLSFAWMGATAEGQPYYFRIAGEEFVYELDATGPDGNHIHTVWRDKADDFGAEALARHYEVHPH